MLGEADRYGVQAPGCFSTNDTTAEADLLLGTLERFAGAGQAILYVSHRLDEIMRIADRVTVFRDGRSAGTFAAADLDEATLVRLIVGADLTVPTVRPRRERAEVPALELKKVSVGPLRDVDLTVEPGEIVGLAGLVGSGRSSLLRSIFGVHPIASGSVLLNGRPVRSAGCRDAIASGVAYVPENRADDAAFAHLSIAANIVTPRIPAYWSLRGMRGDVLRKLPRQSEWAAVLWLVQGAGGQRTAGCGSGDYSV